VTAVEEAGWRRAAAGLWFMMLPTKGARMALRSANGLLLMRQLWVAFVAAVTVLWIPILIIASSGTPRGGTDGRVTAAVVVAVGVLGQLLAVRIAPSVSGATDEAARVSAQRFVFVRAGFGEVGALIGFLGFVVSGNPLVYLAGFSVTMVAMVVAAPTASNIDRMQAALLESGSGVNLLRALVGGGITR
jgi:hypothetical protein